MPVTTQRHLNIAERKEELLHPQHDCISTLLLVVEIAIPVIRALLGGVFRCCYGDRSAITAVSKHACHVHALYSQ